jgi:hypothetical protein
LTFDLTFDGFFGDFGVALLINWWARLSEVAQQKIEPLRRWAHVGEEIRI